MACVAKPRDSVCDPVEFVELTGGGGGSPVEFVEFTGGGGRPVEFVGGGSPVELVESTSLTNTNIPVYSTLKFPIVLPLPR
mgnify:CR=1 FL=1